MRATDHDHRVIALVRRLGRRRCALELARGLSIAGALFLAVLTVAALVDRFTFLEPSARWALFGAVVVPVVVALSIAVARASRRMQPLALALLAERASDGARSFLAGAVELPASADAARNDSLAFRRALQLQAGERSVGVDEGRVVPADRARRAIVVLAALAIILGLVALVPRLGLARHAARVLAPSADIARVSTTRVELALESTVVPLGSDVEVTAVVRPAPHDGARLYYSVGPGVGPGAGLADGSRRSGAIAMRPAGDESGGERFTAVLAGVRGPISIVGRAGDGESARVDLVTRPRPAVQAIRRVYHPPPYLEREPRIVEGPEGELAGLRGSRVDIEIHATESLRAARVVASLQDGSTRAIDLEVAGDRARLAGFPLELPGDLAIELVASDTGFRSRETRSTIEVWPDVAPTIEVAAPVARVVEPRMRLARSVRVGDDVGIASVTETITVNGGDPVTAPLDVARGAASATLGGTIDLGDLALSPGDRVEIRHGVTDLAGSTTEAAPVALVVALPDASTTRAGFPAAYADVVDALADLAATTDGEVRARARTLRGRLEELLPAAPDPLTARDVLLLHSAASAIEHDLVDRGDLRTIARSARVLHAEYALDRVLRRRLGLLVDRLDALETDRRADPADPETRRRAARERAVIAMELRALTESLAQPPSRAPDGIDTPAVIAARVAVGGPLGALESALVDIDGVEDEAGWSILADVADRVLESAEFHVRALRDASPQALADLEGAVPSLSRALGAAGESGRRAARLWLSNESPPDIANRLEALARWAVLVDRHGAIDFDALDALTGSRRRAVAAVSRPEDGARAEADMAILARALEATAARQPVTDMERWIELARARGADASAAEAAPLGERLAEVAGQLERLGRLLPPMEASRELSLLVALAAGIHERHAAGAMLTRRGRLELSERLLALGRELTRVRGVARQSGLDDLDAALERIEREALDGLAGAIDAARLSSARQVELLLAHLVSLRERETPSIHAARNELRGMAPGLVAMIRAAMLASREALGETHAVLDAWRGEDDSEASLPADRHARLVDSESTAGDRTVLLRRRLADDAEALDLTTARARGIARQHDSSLRALREPDPAAGDLLLSLPPLDAANRRSRLARVEAIQTDRAAALALVLEAFELFESGDVDAATRVIEELEKRGGPASEPDERGPLEQLARLRDEQTDLANESERVVESGDSGAGARLAPAQRMLTGTLSGLLETSPGGRELVDALVVARIASARRALEGAATTRAAANEANERRGRRREDELREIAATLDWLEREVRALLEIGIERAGTSARFISRQPIADLIGEAAAAVRHARAPVASARAALERPDVAARRIEEALAALESAAAPLRGALERSRPTRSDTGTGSPTVVETFELVEWLLRAARRLERDLERAAGDPAMLSLARALWKRLGDRAATAARTIDDRLDEADAGDRAPERQDERLRRAAAALEWTARDLESRPSRAIDRLERLERELDTGDGLHRDVADAAGWRADLAAATREVGERLRGLADESTRTGDTGVGRGDELERQTWEIELVLARAAEHARRRDDPRSAAISRALEELRRRSFDAALEAIDGAPPAVVDRPPVADPTPGDVFPPAALEPMATALDEMAGAGAFLDAGDPATALGFQRGAVVQLERALRAIAAEMSRDRREQALEASPGSRSRPPDAIHDETDPTEDPGRTRGPVTGRRGVDDASAPLADLDPGGSDRWFVTLPSELKREIAGGLRERIPPEFRERVEAYYRAVAEAAARERTMER